MQFTSTPSKIMAATTTLALTWALAACAIPGSGGDDTSPEPDDQTAMEPAAENGSADQLGEDATDADAANDADQAEFDGGASDIPLPDGHMVVDEQTAESFDTMLVHAPGEYPEYADWYRSALPGAGWDIVSEEPAPSTFGAVFEVTSDTSRAWVHLETFDGGTAIFISVGGVDADRPSDLAEGGQSTAVVELPEGFPVGIDLPLFSPSVMMTGTGSGAEMWVLEYQAAADVPTVEDVIEQEIEDKNWTLTDQRPEGDGTHYVLEKSGMTLDLVVLPERVEGVDTSIHYTLRFD